MTYTNKHLQLEIFENSNVGRKCGAPNCNSVLFEGGLTPFQTKREMETIERQEQACGRTLVYVYT